MILCRDTDNFKIQPSNLQMAGVDQKQQRVIERNRFRSPFFDLTKENRGAIRKSILKWLAIHCLLIRLLAELTLNSLGRRTVIVFQFCSFSKNIAGRLPSL